jgi:hypothetical protein
MIDSLERGGEVMNTMLLITKVEAEEVEKREYVQVDRWNRSEFLSYEDFADVDVSTIMSMTTTEHIYPRYYRTVEKNGFTSERWIGMRDEVEKILGVNFDAETAVADRMRNMEKHAAGVRMELSRAHGRLCQYRTLSLWQRIKFLFGWNPEEGTNEN